MCCIFQIAEHGSSVQEYTDHLFGLARSGELKVELPGIVRLELLVNPYRSGDAAELNKVRTLLELTAGVRRVDISEDVLLAAASVRAQTRMKTPDALVVGSALVSRCDAIVGNDRAFLRLRPMSEIRVMSAAKIYRVPAYVHIDDYLDDN